jgi:hypothetical protein
MFCIFFSYHIGYLLIPEIVRGELVRSGQSQSGVAKSNAGDMDAEIFVENAPSIRRQTKLNIQIS